MGATFGRSGTFSGRSTIICADSAGATVRNVESASGFRIEVNGFMIGRIYRGYASDHHCFSISYLLEFGAGFGFPCTVVGRSVLEYAFKV